MCYTCNPNCDNCMPKMLKCPACGEVNMISYDECCKCGFAFTEEMREKAKSDWVEGVRLGSSNNGRRKDRPLPPNSPLLRGPIRKPTSTDPAEANQLFFKAN